MAYRVDLAAAARRELRGLDSGVRDRILRALINLEADPRPPSVKKLKGNDNYWRIRVGDYRIIYEIRDQLLIVLVVPIAHRREAYR